MSLENQTTVMPIKPWQYSKTVWVNAITAIISILGVLAGSDLLAEHPQFAVIVTGIVIPILNVILRWLTDEPITSLLSTFDGIRQRIVFPNRFRSVRRHTKHNHNLRY